MSSFTIRYEGGGISAIYDRRYTDPVDITE